MEDFNLSSDLRGLGIAIMKAESSIGNKLNLTDKQRKILFEEFTTITNALSKVSSTKLELMKKMFEIANRI